MYRVNPRSESKVCCGPSPSIIFDEGVFAFDLCPPGMMCKLECPWLSPYLFVSLCEWLITSREQPVLADTRGYCWELGGTHLALCPRAVGCFPQEYSPVICRDFTPEFTPELISRMFGLVNRFGPLSAFTSGNVSSRCDPPVLFDQTLSQPVWSDMGQWVPQVFTLMCLDRFYIWEVTQCRPDRACYCQVTPVMGTGFQWQQLRVRWQVDLCVVVGRGVVESPVSDAAVVPSDMLPVTGWFTALNPQGSQVSLLSSVDSPFGVHVHHPRFLEWVGASESARLLCHPPDEWLQVKNNWLRINWCFCIKSSCEIFVMLWFICILFYAMAANSGKRFPPWPLVPGCRRTHSYSVSAERPWYIAIMCLVGEGRMPLCAGAIYLVYGHSQFRRTPTAVFPASGIWSGCLRCGRVLILSVVFVIGSRRMYLHVVSLVGRWPLIPKWFPTPNCIVTHSTVVPVRGAGPSVSNWSSSAKVCWQ